MDHDLDRVRGPWSPDEDELLRRLVQRYGARNWSLISRSIPGRSGKSCRLRWCNQLSPEVEHRAFTAEEDKAILNAHAKFGNKWATIARLLNGRTDNAVKNHWNSTLKRKRQEAEAAGEFPEKRTEKSMRSTSSDNNSGSAALTSDVSDSCEPRVSTELRLGLSWPESNELNNDELARDRAVSSTDQRPQAQEELKTDATLGSEFLAVMREMIKKEVKDYMTGTATDLNWGLQE